MYHWYMPKPTYVSFKVAPEDYAALSQLAGDKGYSFSEMARKCLRAGLRLAPDFSPRDTDHALTRRPPLAPVRRVLADVGA